MRAILADIGGTNTRVALAEGRTVRTDTLRKFRNAEYQGIDEVLAAYIAAEAPGPVQGASVAAAGPVQDGAVEMTNLFDHQGDPWVIDAARVGGATGATRVTILNDLQAQGHALGHIARTNLRRVIPGPEAPGGAMLVVGLGTGVNAAPVHGSGSARVVPPSECGHVNMPVRSEEDLRLLRFVEAQIAARGEPAHCGVEEVLAGRGLGMLADFAAAEAQAVSLGDSAAVLAALDRGDPVAGHAARLYTGILAQVLADLALIHLPYGGIYLIGGMSRAMTPHFARFGLERAFREPRRVDLLTREFSVTVVEDDYAALTGCAAWLAAQV
jgi:glucokinase